ncbi:MAG: hypothetical protein O3A46_17800 [Candidatus Poribacteria bacterium]|nr:hypothetical protein [Candidatus Poribacteria bacterium]
MTHRLILERMGIPNVVSPEEDAGRRLAQRLINPGLVDFLNLSNEYLIAEVKTPDEFVGKTLVELDLRKRFQVSVVTIRRTSRGRVVVIGVPAADTAIEANDVLILLGKPGDIYRLTEGDNI